MHQNCKGSPLSGDEPAYEPDKYNGNKLIQQTHNCLAYAMGVVDSGQTTQCPAGAGAGCRYLYHQPGGTQGQSGELRGADGRSCPVVERLMRLDVPDIRDTTFEERCPAGSSKIALVVHPGEDYHFYRQDSDGWWSHKDGANTVKRFDADGREIWNPLTAERDYRPKGSFLNYRDFCGFYCVPRRHTIRLARGGFRSEAKACSRRARFRRRRQIHSRRQVNSHVPRRQTRRRRQIHSRRQVNSHGTRHAKQILQ